jgi:hypothetical protein
VDFSRFAFGIIDPDPQLQINHTVTELFDNAFRFKGFEIRSMRMAAAAAKGRIYPLTGAD